MKKQTEGPKRPEKAWCAAQLQPGLGSRRQSCRKHEEGLYSPAWTGDVEKEL